MKFVVIVRDESDNVVDRFPFQTWRAAEEYAEAVCWAAINPVTCEVEAM